MRSTAQLAVIRVSVSECVGNVGVITRGDGLNSHRPFFGVYIRSVIQQYGVLMRYRRCFGALATLAIINLPWTSVVAQETAAAERPAKPPTIVIGLKKWTRDQVNQALVDKFGPSEGLESHACGANLVE